MEKYEGEIASLQLEKLEKMRAHVQMMEDELHDLCESEYKSTGKLNSVKIGEKTQAYESYVLSLETLKKT